MKLKQGLIVSAIAVCALLAGILPATAQTTTQCTGEVSDANLRANVVVPRGQSCLVLNSTITGAVTVGRNADLIVESSTINGNVVTEPNGYLDVFDTAVNGSVRLNRAYGLTMIASGAAADITANRSEFLFILDSDARSNVRATGGDVIIGDDPVSDPDVPRVGLGSRITGDLVTTDTLITDVFNSVMYGDATVSGAEEGSLICTSEFDGQVTLTNNSLGLQIGASGAPFMDDCGVNVMSGDVHILDNSGEIVVADNVIRGNVICEGNDPAPVVGVNRLRGEGVGQCAADLQGDTAAAADTEARLFSSQPAPVDRHAEVNAKVAERRAAAGVDEPTVEEKEEAEENQAETRAAEAEAAPAAPPARPEGRALPPRSRG